MIRCLSLALLSIPLRFFKYAFKIEEKAAKRVLTGVLCTLLVISTWYKIRDPWVPVPAVCLDEYDTNRGFKPGNLYLINGEQSLEFREALRLWLEIRSQDDHFNQKFKLVGKRLYMRESVLTPEEFAISRFAQAPEEVLYFYISDIPHELMKKRRIELDPDYVISLKLWNDETLVVPISEISGDICGVTEKLVLKGGELARD